MSAPKKDENKSDSKGFQSNKLRNKGRILLDVAVNMNRTEKKGVEVCKHYIQKYSDARLGLFVLCQLTPHFLICFVFC